MFEISSKKIDLGKQNICKKKNISLNKNLDCFIVINSDNEKFLDLTIRNILDYLIDKISLNNTYKEFSIALENINCFIKKWKVDEKNDTKIDIFIGILHKNNFMFSNIGNCSAYLIKEDNDIIELINKNEKNEEFNFISNGKLKENEIILISSNILLDYLSISDIKDGIDKQKNIEIIFQNIETILRKEIIENNLILTIIKNNPKIIEETAIIVEKKYTIEKIKNDLKKSKVIKNITKIIIDNKSKINMTNNNSKKIKSLFIILGITISLLLMYKVLFNVVNITTVNNEKETAQVELQKAKSYVQIASENIINNEVFELNIKNAQEIISSIENKDLFLNDISKLTEDINILRKQFNKVEIFSDKPEFALYTGDLKNSVKIIKTSQKPYIINKKGVIGPILPKVDAKTYTFNSLESNEYFVDAKALGNNIVLLTNFSKIVNFSNNGHFEYSDVISQSTWEKSKEINSYNSNIYLLGKEKNQIFKHTKTQNRFTQGKGYLKDDDLTQIGEILSIAIDGGFYILKKDLSIIKFFSSPYRIEKISLNNLPDNYDIEIEDSTINLKTRAELNYVYLLMNNKIRIFKPNSLNYTDTKALTYIGQIEGNNEIIKDFYINYDGEIIVLNKKGIYKLNYEVSDDKIIIR